MTRSLITLALSFFLLAEASAQTTPTTAATKAAKKEAKADKKAAKANARAAKKANKEAERLARKSATKSADAMANDGWPPVEEAPVMASAAGTTGWEAPAEVPVHMRPDDVVYAGPGMAVKVQSNKMVPYSVRPARKPASETTLGR